MKKKIFALLLLTAACQKKQENNSNNSSSDTEQKNSVTINTEIKAEEKSEKPKKQEEILQEFRENTWYEGRIKDLDIWFYAPKGGFAFYGYNSSKGASIELINKGEKDKKAFKFETTMSPNKETFEGRVENDGVIRGKWRSGSKSFDLELKPVNFSNPSNTKEFLEFFADLKLPFQADDGSRNSQTFKDYYQEKRFRRSIKNLTDFIPYDYFNILKNDATLWGKVKVGENYLVIFQAELIGKSYEEKTTIEHDSYVLSNEDMFFAALLDKDGKVLDARIIGNRPADDGAYYLDFSFEITKNKEIAITWTQFMRGDGGARMEAGTDKQIIKIKGNKFE